MYHIVYLLLIIEYILTAATPNCSVFHVKFLVQMILNLCELFLGHKITDSIFTSTTLDREETQEIMDGVGIDHNSSMAQENIMA